MGDHAHRNRLPRLRRQRLENHRTRRSFRRRTLRLRTGRARRAAWKRTPRSRPLSQRFSGQLRSAAGQPHRRPRTGNVLLTVKAFSREFPTGKHLGLMLVGEPGTGKTHLAVAALRILISRGFEGLFFDYQNLLDRIRAGFNHGLRFRRPRSIPLCAGYRSPVAGRSGRAPRHRLGGRYGDEHHHLPLQQQETADRHHQPSRSRRRQCR